MKIEKEDFEQWQAHPVTEAVMRALKILSEQNRQRWIEQSWNGGNADPVFLVELRARAQANDDLRELTFEELKEALDEE